MRQAPVNAAIAAVFLAAAVAVYTAADLFQLSAASNRGPQDPYFTGMQDARFAGLAAAVPPGTTLAYASDVAPESVVGQAMYYTAQYALAPRLLVRVEKADPLKASQVVGNFQRPPDLAALRLTLVRDFGNGVMLLARADKN